MENDEDMEKNYGVKKTSKKCCYGLCKSDTRLKNFDSDKIVFYKIPKPCQSVKNDRINHRDIVRHLKKCNFCLKSNKWVKACGRTDKFFSSILNVNKNHFICSLHFHNQEGPSDLHPDPIPFVVKQKEEVDSSRKKRTSLMEKYNKRVKTVDNNLQDGKQEDEAEEEVLDESNNVVSSDSSVQTQTEYESVKEISNVSHNSNISVGTQTKKHTTHQGSQTTITSETRELKKLKSKYIQIVPTNASKIQRFVLDLKRNEKLCVFYTGLKFHQIKTLYQYLSPGCTILQYVKATKSDNTLNKIIKRKCSPLEQLIIVLTRLRRGLLLQDLAYRFGISVSLISKMVNEWLNFMYEEFDSNLRPKMFPNRQHIAQYLPAVFKNIKNIRVIIDCTEFYCQQPTNFEHRGNVYSNYKAHPTFKVLIGCTPNGPINFVSSVYEGSISDPQIFRRSGIVNLLEPGDVVLADRGFTVEEELHEVGAFLNIPPFLKGRKSLTAQEEIKTKIIAKQRIYVEHAVGHLKNFRILNGTIPLTMKNKMSKIVFICACLANFQPPILLD